MFGFLAHPQLTAESEHGSSGNYALLDLIAGLQWVKRNIGEFGGDSGKVTIFGESAGGALVSHLLVSPLSDGLFHAAISQSPGGINTPISHLSESWYARRSGEDAGGKLGHNIADLRALSAAELLKLAAPSVASAATGDFGEYVPIVDGGSSPMIRGACSRTARFTMWR